LAIAVTPRDNRSSHNNSQNSQSFGALLDNPSIPYTPHGDEATVFKYYCPLCMQYFREIMKMKCCGNYLCISCCKDYANTKKIDLIGISHITLIEERFVNPNNTPCPHCGVTGFHPMGVSFEEIIRDYSTRNGPKDQFTNPGYSPLRVGESFEDLKRKMIPYKSQQPIQSINADISTPRDSEEVVGRFDADSLSPRRLAPGIAFSPEVHTAREFVGHSNDNSHAYLVDVGNTSTNVSPRRRIELNTPTHPLSSRNEPLAEEDGELLCRGAAENSNTRLFADDSSGPFTYPEPDAQPGAGVDYTAQPRLQLVAQAQDKMNDENAVPSPNEIRFGSPSPRFATAIYPVHTISTAAAAHATTTTSAKSSAESKNSDREDHVHSSRQYAEHGNLYAESHTYECASHLVGQLLRAAVSQQTLAVQ